ncbi:MAG: PadR family transcriptional regulator [Actinomycetota bacterium]
MASSPALSSTDHVVLALLGEGPTHGFAIARELGPDGDLGRVLTVRRSLVYRSLDRLAERGLVESLHDEPGNAGPTRTVLRATLAGRELTHRWLSRPSEHVRDLRIELLAKLRLLERAGTDPAGLVEAQRDALATTLDRLSELAPGSDVVDRWRSHNARAAAAFLDELSAGARLR